LVGVVQSWNLTKPSSKQAVARLAKLGMGKSATVVVHEADKNLYLSLRNVPLVDVCTVGDLNARQVLLRRWMVVTPQALEALKQRCVAANA